VAGEIADPRDFVSEEELIRYRGIDEMLEVRRYSSYE
jgi:hypothetical protein